MFKQLSKDEKSLLRLQRVRDLEALVARLNETDLPESEVWDAISKATDPATYTDHLNEYVSYAPGWYGNEDRPVLIYEHGGFCSKASDLIEDVARLTDLFDWCNRDDADTCCDCNLAVDTYPHFTRCSAPYFVGDGYINCPSCANANARDDVWADAHDSKGYLPDWWDNDEGADIDSTYGHYEYQLFDGASWLDEGPEGVEIPSCLVRRAFSEEDLDDLAVARPATLSLFEERYGLEVVIQNSSFLQYHPSNSFGQKVWIRVPNTEEEKAVSFPAKPAPFDAWMAQVDSHLRHACGFTTDDFEDRPYWDLWNDGAEAIEVAEDLLMGNSFYEAAKKRGKA